MGESQDTFRKVFKAELEDAEFRSRILVDG
jgi:hypothetical protein